MSVNDNWRDILLPEGLIEDLLRSSFGLTEEQCRGLFASAESLLCVEYPKYQNYVGRKLALDSRKYGALLVVSD
jgi:hypothetical protein